jgi:hypothetical protein
MPQPSLTAEQIIEAFELQVNDITELADQEELDLLNRVYQRLYTDRDWEFAKKTVSGNYLTDANGAFIPLPADFSHIPINNEYTDNSIGVDNNAAPKVIFMIQSGAQSTYTPFQVINWSDRRQYVNRSGFVYVDLNFNLTTYPQGILRFTGGPSYVPPYTAYEYDYICVPPLLALTDTPLFPGKFHNILQFKMATENDVLQLSPKATSFQVDNEAKYQEYLLDLQFWNSNFYQN